VKKTKVKNNVHRPEKKTRWGQDLIFKAKGRRKRSKEERNGNLKNEGKTHKGTEFHRGVM